MKDKPFEKLKIECEDDPNKLIDEVGDRWFTVCDETVDPRNRHPDHPRVVRLTDCEWDVYIDVTTFIDDESTMQTARALCRLLNQEYKKIEEK